MIDDLQNDAKWSRISPCDIAYVDGVLKLIHQRYQDKMPHLSQFIERELWCDVLKSIASGKAKDPKALAIRCLRTLNMDFDRNYQPKVVDNGQVKPA